MPSNTSLAIWLASHGWMLFPCGPDKRPLTSNGFHAATHNLAAIESWWQQWPAAIIGLPCELNGCFALDVDGKGGHDGKVDGYATLHQLTPDQHPQAGIMQSTPSGGLHLLYKLPEGIKIPNNASKLGQGLDLRSAGYICTGHLPDGRSYTPMAGHEFDKPLLPAPIWLMNAIQQMLARRTSKRAHPTLNRAPSNSAGDYWLSQALGIAHNGNRNDTGFWLACQLRDAGIPEAEAEAIVLSYVGKVPGDGYTEAEAMKSLRSAYSQPARPPARSVRSYAMRTRQAQPAATPPEPEGPEEPETPPEPEGPAENADPDEAQKIILAKIIGGRLFWGDDVLLNCSATIARELIRDNGMDAPKVSYSIEGKLTTGEPLETLEIPAEEFDTMKWLASWGARVWTYLSPGKSWSIARAMKELAAADGLKRERVYTYSGWATIGGKPAYLTTSGAITPDGHDPTVRVDLGENNLRHYSLPCPPEDPRAALQASLSFLDVAPIGITAPLWAAMYTAPLGEMIHLNAVLWVYGGTQSRKSTIAMLALTHFGKDFIVARNHEYRAPAEWISTDTNLEGLLFSTKDLPFVIDDYAPQHTSPIEAKRIAKTANRVIRTVGNRSARGRSSADLTERALRPPRGLVISTAELPMVGQSIEGRMIYVTVNKGEIQISPDGKGKLDQAQALGGDGIYAQAMAAYVRWMAANWETVRQNVHKDYAAADLYARSKFNSEQARLIDYYATLISGVQNVLRFALEVRAITRQEYDTRLTAISASIEALLVNQSGRIAQQSPALRYFEALSDLQTQGKIYLAPRRATEPGEENPPAPAFGAQLVGWYGSDKGGNRRLYLLTTMCLQKVKEYWEGAGETFDMLPDALRRQLFQAGLLVQKDPRQFEPAVWIGSAGQSQRVAVIDVGKVGELLGGISLWPEKIVTNEYDDGY